MGHTLLIILPVDECRPETRVRWLLVDEGDQPLSQGKSALGELASRPELKDRFAVAVIVAAEYALSLRVEIPSSQLRQIRQALPFAVEEMIADDIDNIHAAIPSTFRASLPQIDTAIVNHRLLIDWLDVLHGCDLSPDFMLIDGLCLPREEGSWTIAVVDQRVLIRTDKNRVVAVQPDDVELVIGAMLEQQQQERSAEAVALVDRPQLHIMASQTSGRDANVVKQIAAFLKKAYADYTIKATLYKQDPAQLLSFDWQDQALHGINLLQGGYATQQASEGMQRHWGLVASVASVGVLLFLVLTLSAGWIFQIRAGQLQDQSITAYRQIFPNERRVVNPRKQLQNHLRERGTQGNHSFLALLAETARGIQGESASPDITLTQIRFNSDQGNLRFEVNGRSLDQLDQFKNLLASSGLQVDINSASEQEGGVIGRIVVSQP